VTSNRVYLVTVVQYTRCFGKSGLDARWNLARCDEGYRCEVCGSDVASITDSDLYLRYVLGEVPLEKLHLLPERHIRCNPAVAQYVVDAGFEVVVCDGAFAKSQFDSNFVHAEEERITNGWRRLQAIPTLGLSVAEYPLSITPNPASRLA
jgi:hypothetical protein